MAFDLKDRKSLPNLNFFPVAKEIQLRIPAANLIREAFSDLGKDDFSLISSLAVVESRVEFRPELHLRFEYLSFDCVKPDKGNPEMGEFEVKYSSNAPVLNRTTCMAASRQVPGVKQQRKDRLALSN